ncbi:MAG TPA: alkaline phosphatase family protein [Solimonas sp.]|nr:alkaline phosphatase family protein [Solimonas sp.]
MSKSSDSKGRRGLTRREFIAGATAVAAGNLGLPGCANEKAAAAATAATTASLPAPEASGIDHIVVVMMENRSFDHFLGWVPGADGIQAGVTQIDRDGNPHQSWDLAPNFQNCNLNDPDHSYAGGHTQVNDGKMDGFLQTQPTGDIFPIGYYTAESLPFFKGCADNWTICDKYFSGILGLTTPNRVYMHAGQTDRVSNTVDISTLPTVWDRMLEKGRSVAYYYTDVSYTSFWGDKYKPFSKKYDMASFAADIAAGPLPDLMFVDNVGNTLDEGGAISMDDHPYADIRNGQAFLNAVYDVLRQSPSWERTLVVINYDEWGGFYDHVPPPIAPVSADEAALGNDGRLGCRVPCVLIGPRARRGHVEHMQLDPNSILNMIAWRFGFEPLGVRTNSANLALALDFDSPPNLSAPAFEVPSGRFGGLCIPIQFLASNSSPVPLPVPPLPVDPIPLPVPVQFPSIPGFDVPVTQPELPTLLGGMLAESAKRRTEHEQELQDLRAMGASFGF